MGILDSFTSKLGALYCKSVRKLVQWKKDFESFKFRRSSINARIRILIKPYHQLGLRREALMYVLETQVYSDHRDRCDSVLSALRQNKYSYEIYQEIATLAYKRYLEKQVRSALKDGVPDFT